MIIKVKKEGSIDLRFQILVIGILGPTLQLIPLLAQMTSREEKNKAAANAEIFFKEAVYNFGRIQTGEQVTKKFEFRNNGKENLIIQQLRTTCGCTAAVASTGPYAPGESGSIEVSYDSRGKIGFATKEVQVLSNDWRGPQILRLEGTVLATAHPSKAPGDVLFSGKCAECHSVPAQGKSGKALYDAVCYLCHDFPPEHGKPRIAPSKEAMATISKKRLKRLISEGIPNSSMPGFAHTAGGPLTKEQINSLVDYILSLERKK